MLAARPPPCVTTLLEKEIRSVMSKQIRARMSAKLNTAVKMAYSSLIKGDSVPDGVGVVIIEDRSCRRNGDLQYSDPRFVNVLEALMSVIPEKVIEIGPGQLAYAELSVWWFLKGKEAFPKGTSREGKLPQAAYKDFLEEASKGWREPRVHVCRSKVPAVDVKPGAKRRADAVVDYECHSRSVMSRVSEPQRGRSRGKGVKASLS